MVPPVDASQQQSTSSVHPSASTKGHRGLETPANPTLEAELDAVSIALRSALFARSKEPIKDSLKHQHICSLNFDSLKDSSHQTRSRNWWPALGFGCLNAGLWTSDFWFEQINTFVQSTTELPSLEGWSVRPHGNSADTCQNSLCWTSGGQLGATYLNKSPKLWESEVAEAMPHLAGFNSGSECLYPVDSFAGLDHQVHQSVSASKGVRESIFLSPELFPFLKLEMIEDVLQHYDYATAVKHLMMLSQCVAESCCNSAKEVPNEASWHAETMKSDSSNSKDVCDSTSSLAKLDYLQKQFPCMGATEVQAVLEACDDHLETAVQLLNTFDNEYATKAASAETADKPAISSDSACGQFDKHCHEMSATLQQLCNCFPEASEDLVEVALQLSNFNVAEAHKTLVDHGYTEVVNVGDSTEQSVRAQNENARAKSPAATCTQGLASQPKSANKSSLSELTFSRNQQIYEEERMRQTRLLQAKNKCCELAKAARQRGEYHLAEQWYQQAKKYDEQHDLEGKQATRRISKRVNASGPLSTIFEDLHGKHVQEALEMVLEQIRSLPTCFSRGVQVTYITGKGLHSSNGCKLKPALMELLANHNIQYKEHPGSVVAIFAPL